MLRAAIDGAEVVMDVYMREMIIIKVNGKVCGRERVGGGVLIQLFMFLLTSAHPA